MKKMIQMMRWPSAVLAVCVVVDVQTCFAAPRHRAANPRAVQYNPRGVADPRGLADPRGVYDTRGVADARVAYDHGVPEIRTATHYLYALPGYTTIQVYSGVTYYYSNNTYYYVYYINGRAVYVEAPVVDGVPTVPPQPY
ncbi:MAG: hypothetical protein O3B24_01240 [Verrucomicrobia bacterium]|nr:hypothetical protein [Verrucomicrobiota bacterium]